MKARFLIPLALFLVLIGFLFVGLERDPREVPSPLIGKPAPAFQLAQLADSSKQFNPDSLKGQVWMLNVFASWCVSCKVEHPLLMQFGQANVVPLIGLDYKDKPEDALKYLKQNGDPYGLVATDLDGRVGINFGVYGVPETYIIDKAGIIRRKVIGPITPEDLQQNILPLLNKLKQS